LPFCFLPVQYSYTNSIFFFFLDPLLRRSFWRYLWIFPPSLRLFRFQAPRAPSPYIFNFPSTSRSQKPFSKLFFFPPSCPFLHARSAYTLLLSDPEHRCTRRVSRADVLPHFPPFLLHHQPWRYLFHGARPASFVQTFSWFFFLRSVHVSLTANSSALSSAGLLEPLQRTSLFLTSGRVVPYFLYSTRRVPSFLPFCCGDSVVLDLLIRSLSSFLLAYFPLLCRERTAGLLCVFFKNSVFLFLMISSFSFFFFFLPASFPFLSL